MIAELNQKGGQETMRLAKQVLFTISITFVAVFLTACSIEVKTSEISKQAISEQDKNLKYIKNYTNYLYDSETKMCLMHYGYHDFRGSVVPVPCLNVVEKLSPEQQKQYLADADKHLDKVQ